MIVMKFGGTSLGSTQSLERVLEIVRGALPRRPVLVVSAHSGVTNALVELAERAPAGDIDCTAVTGRHGTLLRELDLDPGLLDDLHQELSDLTRGMKLVGEASPRAVDHLLSFGERCSSRVVAALLSARGIPARALASWELGLTTDSRFGRARPLPDHQPAMTEALAAIPELPVVTGFIGKDERGNITTLGRNGSDLSASLIGHAVGAEEIQIWTDVDGVMSADPSMVPTARPIVTMSFDEASELAYYGGKVLHPASLVPAMQKGIPVRVLNTHAPDGAGTVIVPEAVGDGSVVRSIVYKEGIHIISLVTPRMLQQPGYLARVFNLAAEHGVDVDLVATSEVSITMTTDRAESLPGFARGLEALGEVHVEDRQALLCVVGHGIAATRGVAARVLAVLAEAGVHVRVISQGAIKVNVALIIAEADLESSVRALHREFFEAD